MVTQVSGDLRVITSTPAKITSVDVRSTTTRPSGDGLMLGQWVTLSKPGEFNAASAEVDFPAVPGPAQIKLFSGGSTVGSVALVVPDADSASLADCVRNAEMAGDRDVGELAGILEQIRGSVGASAEARAGAEAAAADAAGSAESAGRDAARAEAAAGEAATEAAGLAADAVRLEVKEDADRSAAGATTATEKAAEAAGSATRAEEAEAGAVEAEEGAVAGQELSEDAAAVAVAAAIGVQASFHQYAGVGFPEGRLSAPVGAVYTDTAATAGAVRWIKTAGTGNTGWQVAYGDTGIRRLRPPALTDGKVTIRRINDLVTVSLNGASFGTLAGQQTLEGVVPVGFRTATWWPFSTVGVYGPVLHGRTLTGTSIQLFGLKAGDTVQAGISFTSTDPWPSTLPGTPG